MGNSERGDLGFGLSDFNLSLTYLYRIINIQWKLLNNGKNVVILSSAWWLISMNNIWNFRAGCFHSSPTFASLTSNYTCLIAISPLNYLLRIKEYPEELRIFFLTKITSLWQRNYVWKYYTHISRENVLRTMGYQAFETLLWNILPIYKFSEGFQKWNTTVL